MTDNFPTHKPPRHRLLRFLIPVLLAHGLLLAVLPYWLDRQPAAQPGMTVELLPITADSVGSLPAAEAAPEPTAAPAPVEPHEPKLAPTPPVIAMTPAAPPAATPEPAPSPTSEAVQTADLPATVTSHTPTATNNRATGTPTHRDDPPWHDDYLTSLRAALAALHHYPARARRFGLSGEALIAITISRSGQFSDIQLVRSSDTELLDQAALDTVRRLDHFRPLPADYSEDSWVVSVPLVYRLN